MWLGLGFLHCGLGLAQTHTFLLSATKGQRSDCSARALTPDQAGYFVNNDSNNFQPSKKPVSLQRGLRLPPSEKSISGMSGSQHVPLLSPRPTSESELSASITSNTHLSDL